MNMFNTKMTTEINNKNDVISNECPNPDIGVLMYDGSIKNISEIKIGDLLMGDDSGERKVLSTSSKSSKLQKKELLYKITCGDSSYIVNSSYKLSLYIRKYIFSHPYISGGGEIEYLDTTKLKCIKKKFNSLKSMNEFVNAHMKNEYEIINIKISDFIKLEPNFKMHLFMYRSGVEFSEVELERNPYEYGFNVIGRLISENDEENNQENFNAGILSKYKINSSTNRLKLLAGIIDSQKINIHSPKIKINIRNKILQNDILFLSRSLGFETLLNKTNNYIEINFKKKQKRKNKKNKEFMEHDLIALFLYMDAFSC